MRPILKFIWDEVKFPIILWIHLTLTTAILWHAFKDGLTDNTLTVLPYFWPSAIFWAELMAVYWLLRFMYSDSSLHTHPKPNANVSKLKADEHGLFNEDVGRTGPTPGQEGKVFPCSPKCQVCLQAEKANRSLRCVSTSQPHGPEMACFDKSCIICN